MISEQTLKKWLAPDLPGAIAAPRLLDYEPLRGSYRRGITRRVGVRMRMFDALDALPAYAKIRIRPRVQIAVERIASCEGIYTSLEQLFIVRGGWLAILLGGMCATGIGPAKLDGGSRFGTHSAIAVLLWLGLVLPVWRFGTPKNWLAIMAGLAALYLAGSTWLFSWEDGRLPRLVADGVRPGLRGATISMAGLFLAGFIYALCRLMVFQVMIRRHPGDDVVDSLVIALDMVKDLPESPEIGANAQLVCQLELIASRIENELYRHLPSRDPVTANWLRTATREMAGGVRALKHDVLLPGRHGQRSHLATELGRRLVTVGDDAWSEFARDADGSTGPRRVHHIGAAVRAAVAVILLVIGSRIGLDSFPNGLSAEGFDVSAMAGPLILLVLVTLVRWIDPDAEAKLGFVTDLDSLSSRPKS